MTMKKFVTATILSVLIFASCSSQSDQSLEIPTETIGDTTGSPNSTSTPDSPDITTTTAIASETTTSVSYPEGITPARIIIPSIDVDADVVELSIRGEAPEVPSDFDQVGWYVQTRKPGEIGPSVLAGHIDTVNGPAVFARLNELEEGDEIMIVSNDGEERIFSVNTSGQYPKENLPDEVFGFGEGNPELRLITCGGSFDNESGHYRDNLVVYLTETE